MKVVFLSVWYSEGMGYIENCLPKAMASMGHEVHVVTSTAQVYYNDPQYGITYKPYLGNNILDAQTREIDGYKLHRLEFGTLGGKIYLRRLHRKLKEIHPDAVQAFDAFSFLTLQGVVSRILLGYSFFTANHTVASVFPLMNEAESSLSARLWFFLTRSIPGRIVSLFTERCYPATIDALRIAVDYYKVPERKVLLAPLGVDTDLFYPSQEKDADSIRAFRKSLGVNDNEILCIYTGRFTPGKNPLCLAKAINSLVSKNEPFRAIFLGDGPQIEEIRKCKGCIVHEFVPFRELPIFYRIADIGVWPRQESTSMLDAVASGLPVIISNKVQAVERVEGNGLTYIENNVDDMADKLLKLKDRKVRDSFSRFGVQKIRDHFSWYKIASGRIRDYSKFTGQR